MKRKKRIVIKFGTSSITNHTQTLSRPNLLEFVRQITELHQEGVEVIIVSSGAVAAGREVLKHPKLSKELPAKQMFSAVGQSRLVEVWQGLFANYGIHVGQLLLTRGDLNDRYRYLNIRDTLESLLNHQVIPIINENDTVATEEIRVGDNDNLSALVANLIGADLLLLLTDQKGLFDKHPEKHANAILIDRVECIDSKIYSIAGSSTKLGTGGMATKIEAAEVATQSGTPTLIALFSEENVITRIAHGEKLGTYFASSITPKESRKRWLLSEPPQGILVVDEGAAVKLQQEGASLLAVGVTKFEGKFERGAVVKIHSQEGQYIGVGVTCYSYEEIERIKGKRSSHLEEVLGYSYGKEVIHRDEMVISKGEST